MERERQNDRRPERDRTDPNDSGSTNHEELERILEAADRALDATLPMNVEQFLQQQRQRGGQ